MLNVGPGQLMMIFVIALIVLGPDKLPHAMRTVGRVMREVRRISNGFQDELRNAIVEDDTLEDRRRRVETETAAREREAQALARSAERDAATRSNGTTGIDTDAVEAVESAGDGSPRPEKAE